MSVKVPSSDPVPRAVEVGAAPARSAAARPPASPPLSSGTHLRAAAVLMVLTILVGGIAYPLAVTGFAQLLTPSTANGSLVRSANGTVIGSSLAAPPVLLPWMFWPRPSEVGYNAFNGSDSPPGPTDPALVNETLSYLAQYRNSTANASIPLWLITPSGSGIDPDITPDSAFVQIPRIQAEVAIYFQVNLTTAVLDGLIGSQIQTPLFGIPGPSYVDVTTLNVALWEMVHR